MPKADTKAQAQLRRLVLAMREIAKRTSDDLVAVNKEAKEVERATS